MKMNWESMECRLWLQSDVRGYGFMRRLVTEENVNPDDSIVIKAIRNMYLGKEYDISIYEMYKEARDSECPMYALRTLLIEHSDIDTLLDDPTDYLD